MRHVFGVGTWVPCGRFIMERIASGMERLINIGDIRRRLPLKAEQLDTLSGDQSRQQASRAGHVAFGVSRSLGLIEPLLSVWLAMHVA